MRSIALLSSLVLLAAACGANDLDTSDAGPGSIQEPLVTNVSAIDGTASLPSPSQYFCHPTRFVASRGHSQSVVYQWGVADTGAGFQGDYNTINAYTNGNANSDPNAHARQDVQCDSWSNFGGNLAYARMVGEYGLVWSSNGMFSFVEGTKTAYYSDSVCWLAGLASLSNTGETAELDVTSNPGLYTLKASGFRALSATARCAALGRPIGATHWLTSTVASSGLSTLTPAQGVCLIMSFKDNLDDAQIRITTHSSGVMMLQVTSGTGKAMCFSK